ncbi:MAG: hypothetical protein MZV70_39595 [Desulfobacterales bacterium]|nr:hypothetical protein [Desulfobacterales bacterium]
MLFRGGAFGQKQSGAQTSGPVKAVKADARTAKPVVTGITAQVDKTSLDNGGVDHGHRAGPARQTGLHRGLGRQDRAFLALRRRPRQGDRRSGRTSCT